jgi:hypothetical protein
VCVVDEHGRIVEGRRYRHNEPGIRALCARLLRPRLDAEAAILAARATGAAHRGPSRRCCRLTQEPKHCRLAGHPVLICWAFPESWSLSPVPFVNPFAGISQGFGPH